MTTSEELGDRYPVECPNGIVPSNDLNTFHTSHQFINNTLRVWVDGLELNAAGDNSHGVLEVDGSIGYYKLNGVVKAGQRITHSFLSNSTGATGDPFQAGGLIIM